jgi:hypothetical protein
MHKRKIVAQYNSLNTVWYACKVFKPHPGPRIGYTGDAQSPPTKYRWVNLTSETKREWVIIKRTGVITVRWASEEG